LVIGYNQWIGLVGVFTAKEKGYFKDAGLNVEFKQFSGPADGIPPVIAGQLDGTFTTADTPILLAKDAGADVMKNVFIVDTSNGADGIVAQTGINSVKDLKGKTVAATTG
jgi:NitT/TauT family transport system substrate-binding protein